MQMAIASFDRFMTEKDLVRQLIRDAQTGDVHSFERLVVLHEQRVLRLAQRLLLNREAARDAAQEVFLRLYRKLSSVQPDKELGAWLYRLTVNVCFDVLRKMKNEQPMDLTAECVASANDPEQSAAARQHQVLLLNALQKLSPRERQVIVLRDLEGHSTAETAHLLGSSETTVRSQISTARVKLKSFLAGSMGKER